MGIYLNPSNVGLKEILAGDIFVDKTMLISELNKFIEKGNKYICVSRPRRFGKTIATNIMCAYYSKGCDSREIFSKLKISKAKNYEQYLNKLNFIKIDVASEYQNANDKNEMLKDLQKKVRDEFQEQYPKIRFVKNETIANCMMKVYKCNHSRRVRLPCARHIWHTSFCRLFGVSERTIQKRHPTSCNCTRISHWNFAHCKRQGAEQTQ